MRWPEFDADFRARAAAVRAEWSADEDDWSRAAHERWQHGRTLVDIASELMHRGDHVAVHAGGVELLGEVVGVGRDTLRLQHQGDSVDVNVFAGVVMRATRARLPRAPLGVRDDVTFRSRLLEREGGEVIIGLAHARPAVRGVLHVGADHAAVQSDTDDVTYAAIAAVAWIRVLVTD